MNRAQIETFWTQYLAGELSVEDAKLLEEELERNILQRQLLLRDGEVDRQLDALSHSEKTEDDFTAEVMAKWRREQKTTYIVPAGSDDLEEIDDPDETYLPDTPWPILEPSKHDGRRSWIKGTLVAMLLIVCAAYFFRNADWLSEQPQQVAHRPDRPRPDPLQLVKNELPAPDKPVDPKPAPPPPPANPQAVPGPGQPAPIPALGEPQVKVEPPEARNEAAPPAPAAVAPAPPVNGRVADADGKAPAKAVARLTNLEGCQWKGDAPGEWLTEGGVLNLLRGKATVTFNSGAVIEVEGPAWFESNTALEGILRHGKLKATVPDQARDFRLQTPVGTVMEKGPEFAVHTDQDGTTTVTALQGTVAMQESEADGRPGKRTALQAGESQTFAARPIGGPVGVGLKPVQRWQVQGGVIVNGRRFDMKPQVPMNEEEFRKLQQRMLDDLLKQMRDPRFRRQGQLDPFMPHGFPPHPLDFMVPPRGLPGVPGRPGKVIIDGKEVELQDLLKMEFKDFNELRRKAMERANERQPPRKP